MKVVIDISESQYEYLEELVNAGEEPLGYFERVIMRGTPLPKGHGKLKDIDKIISDGINKGFCDWYDEMKYAETIIEAESEE